MLTRLKVRNFKRFEDVEIELGETVVLIGPNNSGKTAALQALALWDIGVKRWNEKRGGRPPAAKRPGVTINRRDLIGVPVPEANLLWRNLHVRDIQRTNGEMKTNNVRIDIVVEGITNETEWACGLEFDYANEESFYCRPLRTSEGESPTWMAVPPAVSGVRVAFLPPMSGLAANETRLDQGAINVRLGEGRTAEVLRNICYQIHTDEGGKEKWDMWKVREPKEKEKAKLRFAELVAGFANADGGAIIVGISDGLPRRIVGIGNDQSVVEHSLKYTMDVVAEFLAYPREIVRCLLVPVKDDAGSKRNCLIIAIARASEVVGVRDKQKRFTYPVRHVTGLTPYDRDMIVERKLHLKEDSYDFVDGFEQMLYDR